MRYFLFIDKCVRDIDYIIDSLTYNTEYYIYDPAIDHLDDLLEKLHDKYTSIGILNHNTTFYKNIYNYWVSDESTSFEKRYVNYDFSNNLYVDDIGNSYNVENVYSENTSVKMWVLVNTMQPVKLDTINNGYESWAEFFSFLQKLKLKTDNLDLLACNIWKDNDWKTALLYISENYLEIRASSNNTGYTGDFILESHDYSLIDIYFTDKILGYKYALVNEYSVLSGMLGPGAGGGVGYSPYFLMAMSDNGFYSLCISNTSGTSRIIYYNGFTAYSFQYNMARYETAYSSCISADGSIELVTSSLGLLKYTRNPTDPMDSQRSYTVIPQSTIYGSEISMSANGVYSVMYSSRYIYLSQNYGNSYSQLVDANVDLSSNSIMSARITRDSKKIIVAMRYLPNSFNGLNYFVFYDLFGANYTNNGLWNNIFIITNSFSYYGISINGYSANYDGSIIYCCYPDSSNKTLLKIKNPFGTISSKTNILNYVYNGFNNICCSGSGRIVVVGSYIYIYISLDEGLTFTQYTSYSINAITSINIDYTGTYIYVLSYEYNYSTYSYNVNISSFNYNESETPVVNITNGFFTSPAIAFNSYQLTTPSDWIITNSVPSTAIYAIVNQSTYFGQYTSLPAGITQWFVCRRNGVGNAASTSPTLSTTVNINQSGFYVIYYHRCNGNAITNDRQYYETHFSIDNKYSVISGTSYGIGWAPIKYVMYLNPGNYTLRLYLKNISGNRSIFISGVYCKFISPNSFINNGNFGYPILTSGTVANLTVNDPSLNNWSFTKTGGVNVLISNQNTTWGFPTPLPTDFTQFMIFQYGTVTGSNGGSTSLSQDVFVDSSGTCVVEYYITCRNTTQPNNLINFTISMGGNSQSYLVGDTVWTKKSLKFINTSVGLKTLSIGTSYTTGATDTSIYLSGITINSYFVTVSDPPTLVSFSGGNRQIVVNFTPPENDGGGTITDYKYSLNGGAFISSGSASSPFTISGLAVNTTYSVVIRATNSAGDSASSNSISATTFNYPSTPTLNSATGGNRQIVITFSPPSSNGGSTITNYKYSLNGGAYLSLGSITSPATITGLAVNTSYTILLKATTAVGDSQTPSNSLNATTFDYPSSPTLVSLTEGNTQLVVAFTPPASNGGSAITDYKYSLNGGAYISAGTTSSPFTISGLTKQITYTVLLKATTVVGDSQSPSNSLSATPYGIPDKPTINVITGNYSVIVSSITGGNGGRTISTYKYSLDGINYITTGNTTVPFTIGGLAAGDGFYVSLKATNIAGDSLASNPFYVLAGMAPDPPNIVRAVSSVSQELYVYFNLPVNDGFTPITTLYYSLNGGTYITANSINSPLVISGLVNGQTYSVSLKVSNIVGTSETSSVFTETIKTIPSSPSITSITSSNQTLSVFFSPPISDGFSPILYHLYSLNGGADVSANSTNSPLVIGGLVNGTSYSVRIRAANIMGVSPYSEAVVSTPVTTPAIPNITNLITSPHALTIYYVYSSNGGSAINDTKYSLNGNEYVSSGNATSPFTINGLVDGTPYTVRLKITNGVGDSGESDASFVYLPYNYNVVNPFSVETNGEIFVLTMRNELNGAIQYKYSYDGINWTPQSLPSSVLTNYNPYRVKWTGNMFLMGGNFSSGGANVLLKSTNGEDFSLLNTSLNYPVYDVETNIEYNNTISFPINTTLVFGGGENDNVKIAYSYDAGSSWSASTNSAEIFTKCANGGVWNRKKWVAVGEGNAPIFDSNSQTWTQTVQNGHTIATSDDGIIWTGRGKSVFSKTGNAVDWSRKHNLFVAVGDGSDNSIASSYDGVFWKGYGKYCMECGNDVKYNGEIWVAVGRKNTNTQKSIAYSEDGKTWIQPAQNDLFRVSGDNVEWNGSVWVVYGTDVSYNKATSVDGKVWNMIYDASNISPSTFFNGTQFLKIVGGQVSASPDGSYWSAPSSISGMSSPKNFAWNFSNEGAANIQPMTIALGDGTNTMAYSNDGIYWKGLGNSVFNVRGNAACWNGEKWIAVGKGGCWYATSYDGISWVQHTENNLFAEAHDVKTNGYVWVVAGEGANRICISVDGVNWAVALNANDIFTTRAHSVVWTGKVWLAYGSGGNTTAICEDKYGRIWQPTPLPNMCVSDLSSVIQQAYGININTTPASSVFYSGWNETGYEAYRMFDGSSNTYYKTSGGFSSQTGMATGNGTKTLLANDVSYIGHPIIVDAGVQSTLKGYTISFPLLSSPQNILREWILLGISGENIWNTLISSQQYAGTVIHRGYLETPPQSLDAKYSQYFCLSNNNQSFRYFVLLSVRSFSQDVALSGFDMFMYNGQTETISKYMRPLVLPTCILHPNPILGGENTYYLAADLSNNIYPIHNIPSPPRIYSNYGTDNLYHSRAVSAAFGGSGKQIITGCGYDGQRIFTTTLNGKILIMTNTEQHGYWGFDTSLNGGVLSSNLPNVYSCCYNNNFVILGGNGGSVITYNTMEIGADTNWYSTNGGDLFNNVYGLASNSAYGTEYYPNTLHFNMGEKLSVITPKNNGNTNTSIHIDLLKQNPI